MAMAVAVTMAVTITMAVTMRMAMAVFVSHQELPFMVLEREVGSGFTSPRSGR